MRPTKDVRGTRCQAPLNFYKQKDTSTIGARHYKVRMEEAKRLLRETDLLNKDISSAVGDEDVGSFIRRFRKQIGVTPRQYREEA